MQGIPALLERLSQDALKALLVLGKPQVAGTKPGRRLSAGEEKVQPISC